MKTLALVGSLLATSLAHASAPADCQDCPDWLFARGDYTHSPVTGGRVTQYAAKPPVEGLPDPRATLSRYTRSQTNLRGADGSNDTVFEVRSFGSTSGGFEAQAERAFNASLQQLNALEPFRRNPWLFYGAAVGGGGFPAGGFGAATPGATPQGPIPSGGFPPFGVPTQPYGGAGPYLPNFYGYPGFYGGFGPFAPPFYGPPRAGWPVPPPAVPAEG